MRVRAAFLLLLGVACVDLTPPPQLDHHPLPPVSDDDAALDVAPGPDTVVPPDATSADATAMQDHFAGMADAGTEPDVGGADAPVPPPPPPPPDAGPPDVLPPADLASAPDLTSPVPPPPPPPPDAASAPDIGPDLAPDLAPDLMPDLPPAPPDTGPPSLVIDDFQAPALTSNNLGSEVTWDHESCARVNGESVCSYAGTGGYHDFIETLANWCAYDVRTYSKVRFKLRTSVAGEVVNVYAGINATSACVATLKPLGTITSTTTMTTYTFDISAFRNQAFALIELDPRSTSATQYILDDFELVP